MSVSKLFKTISSAQVRTFFDEGLSRNETLERLFPQGFDARRTGQALKDFCKRENLSLEYDKAVTLDYIKRGFRIPNSQLFVHDKKIYPAIIRSRLLRDKLIPYQCANEECPTRAMNGLWLGKPLNLDMDHIDGDNSNHRLENLRFLCKNCHGQTETFAAKNTAKAKQGQRSHLCPVCFGHKSSKKAKTCMKCKNVKSKGLG